MDYVKCSENIHNVNDYRLLFEKKFNNKNDLNFVRAPGRINIIGEHIDYCGYSVLPMAINNDIVMVFNTVKSGSKLSLRNTNEIYEPFDVETDYISINDSSPKWFDYFLCGYRGILDYVSENKLVVEKCSIFVMVDGCIPPNSGLSSSSALVVCSALVIMKAFNLNIPKKILAKVCAKCEKYIGTQGGGMDQTISLMATAGSAMLIDFSLSEFSVERVFLPDNAIFVVTNSQEQMNKAASNQFNQRVVESKLSAKVLTVLLQSNLDISEINRLVDMQKKLNLDFSEMLEKIENNLQKMYTREDIVKLLQLSNTAFDSEILSRNTQEMKEFHLYKRAKHVVSEALRVRDFVRLCSTGAGDDDVLNKLGRLMNESQMSCKELYECSSDRLDELVEICRRGGSLGSRLTGAGWGGCVISLLSKEKLDGFMNYVAEQFYNDSRGNIKNLMFVSKPADGASFFH